MQDVRKAQDTRYGLCATRYVSGWYVWRMQCLHRTVSSVISTVVRNQPPASRLRKLEEEVLLLFSSFVTVTSVSEATMSTPFHQQECYLIFIIQTSTQYVKEISPLSEVRSAMKSESLKVKLKTNLRSKWSYTNEDILKPVVKFVLLLQTSNYHRIDFYRIDLKALI